MNKSEEGLVAVNENGFFYRIKNFFRNLFFSNKDKLIISPSLDCNYSWVANSY